MNALNRTIARDLGAKHFTEFSAAWPRRWAKALRKAGCSPHRSNESPEWVIAGVPDFTKPKVMRLFGGFHS